MKTKLAQVRGSNFRLRTESGLGHLSTWKTVKAFGTVHTYTSNCRKTKEWQEERVHA